MGLGQGLLGQIVVLGPQVRPPSAATARGTEPPKSAGMRAVPPSARPPGAQRWSARPASISGRVRRSRRGPRQSNDCTMIRSAGARRIGHRDHGVGHRGAIHGRPGCQGKCLQFDVEAHQRVDAQHIGQRRDAGAVMRHLLRIERRIGAARADAPDIVARPVPPRAASGSRRRARRASRRRGRA